MAPSNCMIEWLNQLGKTQPKIKGDDLLYISPLDEVRYIPSCFKKAISLLLKKHFLASEDWAIISQFQASHFTKATENLAASQFQVHLDTVYLANFNWTFSWQNYSGQKLEETGLHTIAKNWNLTNCTNYCIISIISHAREIQYLGSSNVDLSPLGKGKY